MRVPWRWRPWRARLWIASNCLADQLTAVPLLLAMQAPSPITGRALPRVAAFAAHCKTLPRRAASGSALTVPTPSGCALSLTHLRSHPFQPLYLRGCWLVGAQNTCWSSSRVRRISMCVHRLFALRSVLCVQQGRCTVQPPSCCASLRQQADRRALMAAGCAQVYPCIRSCGGRPSAGKEMLGQALSSASCAVRRMTG
jgi:hypothetical protein